MAKPTNKTRRLSLVERLKDRFIIEETTGCWIWTSSSVSDGYASINIQGYNRKAHIATYEDKYGA